MTLCDKLITKFEVSYLPLIDGIKLNECLRNKLRSRQSYLTKKTKNAKLSSKTFVHTTGFIVNVNEARIFGCQGFFFPRCSEPSKASRDKILYVKEVEGAIQ